MVADFVARAEEARAANRKEMWKPERDNLGSSYVKHYMQCEKSCIEDSGGDAYVQCREKCVEKFVLERGLPVNDNLHFAYDTSYENNAGVGARGY
eukprot:TRINITY_DN3632_c0_g1_i1.p2 TRINITY_DN3632_c0_g1~~TRINITY_DN3632_c0_g1_i1.p2  ORF type:complete len:109 (+),score=29.79 TRINITY_DN3632_c0_g1_i1:43-327(+)